MATLEELRSEHRDELVGARWLEEVRHICGEVVVRYPAEVYAHGLSWRDEIDDLVQEVVVDRLLKERQADYLVHVSATVSDVRRLLARQVRITLAHRRRRTVVDQLLDRARQLLRDSSFEKLTSDPDSWSLAGKSVVDRSASPAELRLAERRVRSIPTIAGDGLERAPTVYRSEDLRQLLSVVAETLPTAFEVRDLDLIFRSLLTSYLPSVLDHVGANALAPTDADTEEIEMSAAREVVDMLDAEQRTIVAAKLSGVADADIAAALGLSRPTVAKRRTLAFDRVRPSLAPFDDEARLRIADRLGMVLAGYWPPSPESQR